MEINIIEKLQGASTPFIDKFFQVITHLGDVFFLAFIFLVFYYAFDKKFALNFIISATLVSAINYGLKAWIKRPRPYVQSSNIIQKSYSSNYSFASGHSTAIASIAVGVIYANKNNKKSLWWICLVCVFVSLLVGLSRMILGHHFLTDVITGLFLGAVLTPYFMWVLQKFNFQKLFSIILGVAGFIGAFLFVNDWFVITTKVNAFMACGAVCGLGFGMFFEQKFINFDVKLLKNKKHVWWVTSLAIFDVGALFLVLNLLPKFGILTFVCLFIVCFFATFVQSFLLKKVYIRLGDL